jgi:catechol 2,3-dioxygenase-like lactoylglutathione lyase family enzyme
VIEPMSTPSRRVGPRPKHLYVRVAVYRDLSAEESLGRRTRKKRAEALDAAGRLVASGGLTNPKGDLLIFRADTRSKAEYLLHTDPLRKASGVEYLVLDWRVDAVGSGVNIEPPPSRGSGRITQLQSVAVVVRDQAKAIEWYRDVLGFMVLEEDPETEFVQLSLGKGSTAISLVVPRREWGEPLYSETLRRAGGSTGILFRTDNVRALQLRLQHAKARVTRTASHEPWGWDVLQFRDPDGNEFLAFEIAKPSSGRRGLSDFTG